MDPPSFIGRQRHYIRARRKPSGNLGEHLDFCCLLLNSFFLRLLSSPCLSSLPRVYRDRAVQSLFWESIDLIPYLWASRYRVRSFRQLGNMTDALKKVQAIAPPSKGKIQLYSKEYFAACTLGGIIGTFFVTQIMTQFNDLTLEYSLWSNTYHGHPSRSRKMPKTSWSQNLLLQHWGLALYFQSRRYSWCLLWLGLSLQPSPPQSSTNVVLVPNLCRILLPRSW